jgi:histone deacetylase complex regulatory component SIN3
MANLEMCFQERVRDDYQRFLNMLIDDNKSPNSVNDLHLQVKSLIGNDADLLEASESFLPNPTPRNGSDAKLDTEPGTKADVH